MGECVWCDDGFTSVSTEIYNWQHWYPGPAYRFIPPSSVFTVFHEFSILTKCFTRKSSNSCSVHFLSAEFHESWREREAKGENINLNKIDGSFLPRLSSFKFKFYSKGIFIHFLLLRKNFFFAQNVLASANSKRYRLRSSNMHCYFPVRRR